MNFSLSTIDVDGAATAVVPADETLYRVQDIALSPQAPARLMGMSLSREPLAWSRRPSHGGPSSTLRRAADN